MATDNPPRSPMMRVVRSVATLILALVVIGVILNVTGCMERMFYYPEKAATPVPRDFAGGEIVYFQSADGTKLAGWFLPSSNATSPRETAPTILHVHGNAGNLEGHIGFTEYLPPAGLNLFIFDYRGYGESEGRPSRRKQLIEDTSAAIDYLLSRTDIDHKRLGMYGQSLGGAIGLNVMAKRTEIRAAVIESAFTSWRDVAANAVGGANPGPFAKFLAWSLIPDSDRPIDAIATIDRPILIIHGNDDTIVPVSHGRALAHAGGNNVTFIEVPGAEHNSLRWTNPEIEPKVIDFYTTNLLSPHNQ